MDINLPMDPPVNNNLQGTLYDKLDAMVFEKTRVANSQLNSRLSIQERMLAKYRQDVEKVHQNQSKRLRREYLKIQDKKPDYVYDDSVVYDNKRRTGNGGGRQRSVSEYGNNSGYCKRYYAHHYNIKDRSKSEGDEAEKTKAPKNDFFNVKLRLYFLNMLKPLCSDNKSLPQTSPEHATANNESSDSRIYANNDSCHENYLDNNQYHNNHEDGHTDILEDVDEDVFDPSNLSSSFDSSLVFSKNIKRSQSLAHPEIASVDTVERKRKQRKIKARQSLQDLSSRSKHVVSLSSEDFEKKKDMWKRSKKVFETVVNGR